jgi:hypothetical protein
MKRKSKIAAAALAVLGAGAIMVASAGPGFGYASGACAHGGPDARPAAMEMSGKGMRGRMGGSPEARVEGRLAFLKTELGITPAQEPAWEAFAATVRAQTEGMAERKRGPRGEGAAQTAPERIDRHLAHMEERLERMQVIAAAAKDLYAQLGDEQKAKADQLLTRRHRGARG